MLLLENKDIFIEMKSKADMYISKCKDLDSLKIYIESFVDEIFSCSDWNVNYDLFQSEFFIDFTDKNAVAEIEVFNEVEESLKLVKISLYDYGVFSCKNLVYFFINNISIKIMKLLFEKYKIKSYL